MIVQAWVGTMLARRGTIAATASAAAVAISGTTEVYTSRVKADVEWPSISCTTLMSTPAARLSVALRWRRSWNRMGGRPASPGRCLIGRSLDCGRSATVRIDEELPWWPFWLPTAACFRSASAFFAARQDAPQRPVRLLPGAGLPFSGGNSRKVGTWPAPGIVVGAPGWCGAGWVLTGQTLGGQALPLAFAPRRRAGGKLVRPGSGVALTPPGAPRFEGGRAAWQLRANWLGPRGPPGWAGDRGFGCSRRSAGTGSAPRGYLPSAGKPGGRVI